MASSVVQLNTRIAADTKREGDVVFARYGLTPSAVVRAVWGYAAEHQQPPEFLLGEEGANDFSHNAASVREGAGLAMRLAGHPAQAGPTIDYASLQDELYDSLAKEYEHHA